LNVVSLACSRHDVEDLELKMTPMVRFHLVSEPSSEILRASGEMNLSGIWSNLHGVARMPGFQQSFDWDIQPLGILLHIQIHAEHKIHHLVHLQVRLYNFQKHSA